MDRTAVRWWSAARALANAGPSTSGTNAYGEPAVFDAIVDGGNNVSPSPGSTFTGISSTAAGAGVNAVIGFVNNDPTGTSPLYNSWRGVDLTGSVSSGQTTGGNKEVIFVSPTWIGDSFLSGKVTSNDYSHWLAGYHAGETHWQSGNFLYQSTTTATSYSAWLAVFHAFPNTLFPNWDSSAPAPSIAGGGSISPNGSIGVVPEPGTISLLAAAAAAGAAFALRRRRTAS